MNQTVFAGPDCKSPTLFLNILHAVFLTFVVVATVFGNLIVITAVSVFHRLRRPTNYMILSLAFSDLLFALMSLPLRIDQVVHNFNWCLGLATCSYWAAVDAVFSSASICNLAAISVDRFIAITKPFEYPRIMNRRAVLCLIGLVWFYAFLWGILALFNWKDPGVQHIIVVRECANSDTIYFTVAAALSFFLPLIITVIAYSRVFKVAFIHAKAIATHTPTVTKKRQKSIARELKAAKTLAIVVGAFVVSWLPFFVIILIAMWCQPCLEPLKENTALATAIKTIFVYVLPPLNSCVNPFIYTVFNREFRAAFSKMFANIKLGKKLGSSGMPEREECITETETFGL